MRLRRLARALRTAATADKASSRDAAGASARLERHGRGSDSRERSEARREYLARRRRESLFGSDLFSDPAWDVLLDLFVAQGEGRRVSVKSACIAAAAPQTTALRYINRLIEAGLVERSPHPTDRRSCLLELTRSGEERMVRYFALVRHSEPESATRSDDGRAAPPRHQQELAGLSMPISSRRSRSGSARR
jgi:DNA-binding MarR family transcriptional regulator